MGMFRVGRRIERIKKNEKKKKRKKKGKKKKKIDVDLMNRKKRVECNVI